MKLNRETKIICDKIILVPYRKVHVDKYHEWMKDDELREMTASDRLTLEEEFAMQQSWLHDPDKCTFIILDMTLYENTDSNEIESMIGDINVYLSEEDNEDKIVGELSLMIAEPTHRGQGKGKQAVLSILRYGIDELKVDKFVVKISISNTISVAMFEKLGFTLESENAVFKEKTLILNVTDNTKNWIKSKEALPIYRIEKTTLNI